MEKITYKQTKNLKMTDDIVTDVEMISDDKLSLFSKNTVRNDVITKSMIDMQEATNVFQYTAFEVFPTDKTIPAHTKDTVEALSSLFPSIAENKTCMFTGFEYTEDVSSGMTQCLAFYVDGDLEKEDCDIVIDWGDGDILSVNTTDTIDQTTYKTTQNDEYILSGESGLVCYNKYTDSRRFIACVHTYTTPNKYKVTVYGNDYFMIRGSDDSLDSTTYTGLSKKFEKIESEEKLYNQICLALFNKDGFVYPVNHHVNNMSSCFKAARKMLCVNSQNLRLHLKNTQSLFSYAYNLKYVYLNQDFFAYINAESYIKYPFNGDRNLESVELYLPSFSLDYRSPDNGKNATFFNNCGLLRELFEKYMLDENGHPKYLYVNFEHLKQLKRIDDLLNS